MHDGVYRAFESLLGDYEITGPTLEIGVIESQRPLLYSSVFDRASRKVAIDREEGTFEDLEFHQTDANDMAEFSQDEFECVVCNAVLEHDRTFWKTLEEIKRVTAPNGLIAIGVPGYSRTHERLPYLDLFRVNDLARRVASGGGQGGGSGGGSDTTRSLWWRVAKRIYALAKDRDRGRQSPTIGVHGYPNDYYRFSSAAVRDVFLEGCEIESVSEVLNPPRLIGIGRMR